MKNKKGFTLIELLAVIVILGLLMAIAIPSVTKYITQSRKKTLTTTIGNYASALVADVNNMEYVFTETDTIYAVPIDCVEVERGGKNPFGEWSPVTENYWAYVLVQYDDSTSSYIYGFTFKDSAGYGLYPTTLEKLKETGSQIQTNLELNKPVEEVIDYLDLVAKEHWDNSGFILTNETKVIVLESDTCSLSKPCKSTSLDIGSLVTCGSDNFYILEKNNDSISILAKYNLDLDTSRQSSDASDFISFSNNMYWYSNGKLKENYGSGFPAYVYDEGSNLYKYVNEYNNYLVSKLKIKSATSTLISAQHAENMGCSIAESTCTNTPSWFIGSYWTGTAIDHDSMKIMHGWSYLYDWAYWGDAGIRPLVTINLEDIKIKNN